MGGRVKVLDMVVLLVCHAFYIRQRGKSAGFGGPVLAGIVRTLYYIYISVL